MRTFGQTIRAARLVKGWGLREVIERLPERIAMSYLCKLETYGEIPAPAMIFKLADALDIDRDELSELAKSEIREKYKKKLDEKYDIERTIAGE